MENDADQSTTNSYDDVKVTDSFLWIRDTRGYGSVTLTFVTIAFWVTTLAYVLSMFKGSLPWINFELRPFDVGASTAYFGIVSAMYTHRKWTETRYRENKKA